MVKQYKLDTVDQSESEIIEQNSVRALFCVVLCYCLTSIKGGWQHLEETVNFILMHFDKVVLHSLSFVVYFNVYFFLTSNMIAITVRSVL